MVIKLTKVQSDLKNEEAKALIKEAISEWLDDQFATFGKWSGVGIAAMVFAAIVYAFFITEGWVPPLHR
jgi:hypothetical protein